MVPTRRHRDTAVVGSGEPEAFDAPFFVERRRHRSRAPFWFSLVGLIVGTIVADVLIVSSFGASFITTAWPVGSLTEAGSWLHAVVALRDPGLALASIAVGGLPGAVAGRALAIRRLRSDRLDSLLSSSGATR